MHANAKKLRETINMRKERITLDQVLEETGYTAMWEANGETREREKWQTVVADKDAKIAVKDAEIVRLRKQLEEMKK
jgi:hypothetical protein